ncbi:hypothetical protein F5148DRAFT_1206618 [Russula earlei]|uniref:Uncharacterized protein n=1 Tax=Russula earlei TaxID=71964 RepID=A0ACC0U6N6_9AGAM|nr:hypothetical protein F5148DRAFT_1206618 [Russula earlei]
MPNICALPFPRAACRRKRDESTPPHIRNLFSACPREAVGASTLPCITEGPFFTPGGTPGWAGQPWPYVFRDSEVAWALGANGRWRLVTVVGDGFFEKIENRMQVAYNVTWMSDGTIMRGTFAPLCGDIKPNTLAIRRLLYDEGLRRIESRDWREIMDDEEGVEVESQERKGFETETDDQGVSVQSEPSMQAL